MGGGEAGNVMLYVNCLHDFPGQYHGKGRPANGGVPSTN